MRRNPLCAKCKVSPKSYKTSAYCKGCLADRARNLRSNGTPAQRESLKAATRRWRQANPEKNRKYARDDYARNAPRRKASTIAWQLRNPDRRATYEMNRLAPGRLAPEEWEAIVARQHGRCAICGEQKKLERDHIIPLTRGGTNYAHNIQGLCRSCNARKGNRIIPAGKLGTTSVFANL